MEITEPISPRRMGELFSKNERLTIPSYQRRFSWEDEHFGDLWNDIRSLEDRENHFFGTIVFKAGTHLAQGVNELDVVDGQQRITTVSILLCTIRDYLQDHYAEERVEDRIDTINEELWLVNRDGERDGLRLRPGNLDQDSYENLIKQRHADVENKHITAAYDYFYEQIDTELDNLSDIRNLHDKILDQLIYVSITAQDHSDAYQLFEAMNNRGLTLSPIDLMKNYLLMQSAHRAGVDEDRIEDLWGEVIKNIDRIPDLNNPGITFFRQYFMSSATIGINEKITTNNLYEPHFTEIIEETPDIESLLEEIKDQSELYRKLLTQNITKFAPGDNAEINRLLRDARIVSITPFTVFLRAFTETNDVDILKRIIEQSNALLIRRQVCDRNTGPHDTIFNHLAHNAFEQANPPSYIRDYLDEEGRFPSDEQFERYFTQADFPRSDSTKYVLAKIEEDHYGHGGKEVVESRYQVHIEHILPELPGKNLTKLWLEPYGISDDEHDDFKKKIGNLTLLEQDPNIRASNRSLQEKQKYYSPNKTDFEMTHELVEIDRWGVDKIQERSESLAEIATNVWSL